MKIQHKIAKLPYSDGYNYRGYCVYGKSGHYTSEICVDGVWYSRDTAIKVLLDKVIDIL